MRLDDFDFELPAEQIAQFPTGERDRSRLMVLDRAGGAVQHRAFLDLPSLLRQGDLLVLNDTRVIPARLIGRKIPTGGRAELLMVRPAAEVSTEGALSGGAGGVDWVCLGQASKGLRPGTRIAFEGGMQAEIVDAPGGGEVRARFSAPEGASLGDLLEAQGRLPLPPYISREPAPEDRERYQTVFAVHPGSVAAPTAGLHFTPAVFDEIERRGVRRAFVTLDVGPGTFMPVREDPEKHKMHSERFSIPEETVRLVAETKARGGRVIAVGTTVVRTLEGATDPDTGLLRPGAGDTAIFIRPGYVFRQVDALVTNFHLPRSTLLMLVSAFAGHAHTLAAYREAVREGYRFFSYGDAMFISEAP